MQHNVPKVDSDKIKECLSQHKEQKSELNAELSNIFKGGVIISVINADQARIAENAGACAIMPLAAPIGSGLGIQNYTNIRIIRNQTKLPVIIDAGIGQASDATIAMELGCDGVLINTAIAKAKKPFEMAEAMKFAVIAGRKSFVSGRISKTLHGSP